MQIPGERKAYAGPGAASHRASDASCAQTFGRWSRNQRWPTVPWPGPRIREVGMEDMGKDDSSLAPMRAPSSLRRCLSRCPLYPRLCCKSRFALVAENCAGRRCDFRLKMWGASSPHVKLTGDLANVSDAIRIGDCVPFRNFAKNQSPCNFRLLQQYPPESDRLLRCREMTRWAQAV
jgi:hypothetical protein